MQYSGVLWSVLWRSGVFYAVFRSSFQRVVGDGAKATDLAETPLSLDKLLWHKALPAKNHPAPPQGAKGITMYRFVTQMPRQIKWGILLLMDVILTPVALLAAFALHQNGFDVMDMPLVNRTAVPLLMVISALVAFVTSTYKIQLKAYETRAITLTAFQTLLLGVSAFLMDQMAGYGTQGAVFITFMLIYLMMAVAARVVMLQVLLAIHRQGAAQCRVLIYGAGATGRQLAAALRMDETIFPIAFIDDNASLQGGIVRGLRVYAGKDILKIARKRRVDRVLLAMPGMPRPRAIQLSRRLEQNGLDVQSLPSFAQLAQQGTLVDQLQPVVPGQFLGREALDSELIGDVDAYAGRTILISGAGGSIGSELCRQLLACGPAKLVLLDISELALYTIEMELQELAEDRDLAIVPVLGSVTDADLVAQILAQQDVQVVLHAAAYKHVPLVEKNAIVGVSNNVLGTHTLAHAAGQAGCERFILISTDKAVRPRNAMGASKRMAEIVVQDLARRMTETGGQTLFSMVRFGNVIGSSGSVIPLFVDQIRKGGPVTLTHRDVTRYFMTIPEAARLVLVAGSFGDGGDVFVLDMGQPIPIYDLARQMIESAGYRVRDKADPDGDIEIITTGLRPGEKMHEELMLGQATYTTSHPKIMKAQEDQLSELEVAAALKALRAAVATRDEAALRAALRRSISQNALTMAPQPMPIIDETPGA